jgi:hypothetical protein
VIQPSFDDSFAAWRDIARKLLAADVPPEEVLWGTEGLALGDGIPQGREKRAQVPRAFLQLSQTAAMHRDSG